MSATEIQWKFGRKLTPEAEETIEEISSDGRIVDAPLPSFFSLFSSRDPDDVSFNTHFPPPSFFLSLDFQRRCGCVVLYAIEGRVLVFVCVVCVE